MNDAPLLAYYERIADAPDAVARLRRFVLDLAVRGKLVAQDSNDEPSTELLKRIAAEKARVVRSGEIGKWKPLAEIAPNEIPFRAPPGWEWARIRKVTSDRGQVVPEGDFTYIDVTAINNEGGCIEDPKVISAEEAPSRARKIICKGDVLYSCVRPYLLNVAIVESEFVPAPIASTAFAVLNGFGLVLPRYQWLVLRSPFMIACVERKMRGQAYPAINDSDFALLPIPLPPLAEQHRIVAKLDELMTVCDRLEVARAAREATRDRLTAACLARLNGPDPETFHDYAHFVLSSLPAISTRADQIQHIRQTILNLAVRGKVVPQDPEDEPASDLLTRITAEMTRRGRNGLSEGRATAESMTDKEKVLSLPSGWCWIRLRQIAEIGTGLTPAKSQPAYYDGGDIPWVNSGATAGNVIREARHFVTEIAVRECRLKVYPAGSLVVALYGQGKTRGQIAELGIAATVNQACAVIQWLPSFRELKGFTRLALEQQYESMREQAAGGPQPNLNLGKIKERVLALPPLAEQHRIVAKVNNIMLLCDRLEASLVAGDDTRRRLLEALLAEALVPANRAVPDDEPDRVAAHG